LRRFNFQGRIGIHVFTRFLCMEPGSRKTSNNPSLPEYRHQRWAQATGISAEAIGVGVHSMRTTAATNALSHEADIAKVQEWQGQRQLLHHPPLRPAQEQA
jgi:hypothetical protein